MKKLLRKLFPKEKKRQITFTPANGRVCEIFVSQDTWDWLCERIKIRLREEKKHSSLGRNLKHVRPQLPSFLIEAHGHITSRGKEFTESTLRKYLRHLDNTERR